MPDLRIVCREDCGNAPRKALLRDFHVALADGDLDAALAWLSDSVVWEWVGEKTAAGKAEAAEALRAVPPVEELIIEAIITHGAHAAAHGTFTSAQGVTSGFCQVYRFESAGRQAKIKSVKSYVIRLE